MSFVNGQGRKVLVNTTLNVAVVPTSVAFGSFLVSEFAGIAGMVKCDSAFGVSLQLQYQMDSGNATLVTSTVLVSSGIVVSEFNPGPHVSIGLLGVASATPVRVYLSGLPIR